MPPHLLIQAVEFFERQDGEDVHVIAQKFLQRLEDENPDIYTEYAKTYSDELIVVFESLAADKQWVREHRKTES